MKKILSTAFALVALLAFSGIACAKQDVCLVQKLGLELPCEEGDVLLIYDIKDIGPFKNSLQAIAFLCDMDKAVINQPRGVVCVYKKKDGLKDFSVKEEKPVRRNPRIP